jgi:hypothetical protein
MDDTRIRHNGDELHRALILAWFANTLGRLGSASVRFI